MFDCETCYLYLKEKKRYWKCCQSGKLKDISTIRSNMMDGSNWVARTVLKDKYLETICNKIYIFVMKILVVTLHFIVVWSWCSQRIKWSTNISELGSFIMSKDYKAIVCKVFVVQGNRLQYARFHLLSRK